MDWVHCNACFVQPGSSSRTFSLTNCGHVFCQECIQVSAPQTCNVCKTQCNVIPLTSNLKPDVEIFFMDPADLLKKQQKQYLQVLEFQKSHRKRLISHFHKSITSQGTNSGPSHPRWQEMERELKKLVEENIMLKQMIGAMNGDPKNRGNSSRPAVTNYRGVSPGPNSFQQRGHYTPSGHHQTSPYSRSAPVTPQMTNSMKSSQRADTPKTPAGPIRLTIRTPPSNGMLGRIGTPPSGRSHNTHGIVANLLRAGNTPGAREALTPSGRRASLGDQSHTANCSPTRHSQLSDSNSISSQRRHWSSSQPNTPGQHTSSAYSSQNLTPHSQHHHQQQTARKQDNLAAADINKRQIQLHYQPRQSGHQ